MGYNRETNTSRDKMDIWFMAKVGIAEESLGGRLPTNSARQLVIQRENIRIDGLTK